MPGPAFTLGGRRYVPIEHLASGGSADLFLAEIEGGPRRVVVKRPRASASAAWFERECRLGRTLEHPGLARVIDDGITSNGERILVLEHLAGADLRTILGRMAATGVRAFPLDAAVALGREIARILAYLHQQGVVHGDLAPSNLFVGTAGDVRLLDLGFARVVGEEDAEGGSGSRAAGTVSYMSPEQAAGAPLDQQSDVFSLGVVLFELATGKRLFRGQTNHETLRMIQDRDAPRPSEVVPGFPATLEHVLGGMLGRDPMGRMSAAAVSIHLDDFARAEGHRPPAEVLRQLVWPGEEAPPSY